METQAIFYWPDGTWFYRGSPDLLRHMRSNSNFIREELPIYMGWDAIEAYVHKQTTR